jgi:hypothetical protein
MIISEKHQQIIQEFIEYGELSNNIKLLHYGVLLKQAMKRLNCTLDELLNAINEAAQQQIGKYELGRAIL